MNVLMFGIAKEICGGSIVDIPIQQGATVESFKATLAHQYPELKKLTSFAIAVNGEYASGATILSSADEIAIIPPVSGG